MKTLFGFAVGYAVGSRAGSPGLERVEKALRDLRNSEEFRGFVVALKDLASQTTARLSGSGRDTS